MFRTKCLRNWLLLLTMLCLSATGARAANILFISSGTPSGDDQPMIDYLESKDHVVTIMDDDDVASQGEAAAMLNDAVIASETSSSHRVAELPKDLPKPIVCLEYYAWDDFGMITGAADNGAATSTDVTIVTPGHYLAAGLSGNVAVLTSTGHAIANGGGIGGDAVIIARAEGFGDIIFAYEKGSTLADGTLFG